MRFERIRSKLRSIVAPNPFYNLNKSVIELNTAGELKKFFRWKNDPVIDDSSIFDYEYIEDGNERRIRDAEVLGTVCRNVNKGLMLEIGTSTGHSTALMSANAPDARIYTVNILPDEIRSGKGGELTSITLEKEQIGSYYREKQCKNVYQIFANTATWEPDIGIIDVAFIDGCHDTDFAYNDSIKVIKNMSPGSFILWHDFNPLLVKQFSWINNVCIGIERLYTAGQISGRIFHVKDSWIGVHRLPT